MLEVERETNSISLLDLSFEVLHDQALEAPIPKRKDAFDLSSHKNANDGNSRGPELFHLVRIAQSIADKLSLLIELLQES